MVAVATTLRRLWSAVRRLPWQRFGAGVLAGAAGLLLTFLLRLYGLGIFLPEEAVNFAVGRLPGELESFFIHTLGAWAKALALLVAIGVFLTLAGILAVFFRRLQRRVPSRWGLIGVYALASAGLSLLIVLPLLGDGLVGAQSAAGPWAAGFSTLLGSLLYAAFLDYFLVEVKAKHPQGFGFTRREFIRFTAVALFASAIAIAGLSAILPKVARLAFASVAEMLGKEVTPNAEFYTVTKNVIDPSVDGGSWRLGVDGLVTAVASHSLSDLNARMAVEEHVTLECVSNEVGGNLISTAKWSGVRLADLLDAAGVQPDADWVRFTCADGYIVGVPMAKARDPRTLVALRMNNEVLPDRHGFPSRIVVPGLYGMFHAKWLTNVTAVQGEVLGFWQQKGWTNEGRIRSTAILATPPADSVISGAVTLGGVAFSGDRGISRVEVSTDGGSTWSAATLKTPLSPLTWVIWTFPWTPPRSGSYRILARAVEGDGTAQESGPSPPFSRGASGYDSVTLLVS